MADGVIWQGIGDFNALTSGVGVGGTIDITGAGGGATPTGCLIFYSARPASLPGQVDDMSRGVGMVVSSPALDYGCCYGAAEDGQSAADLSRAFARKGEALDAAVITLVPGTTTTDIRLVADSFIANGIRLEIAVDNDSAELSIVCLFFENETSLLEIDTDGLTTISDLNFSYSDAFRFFASVGDNAYAATADDLRLSMGIADNDGQGHIGQWEENGATTTIATASNWNDGVVIGQTSEYSRARYGLTNESGATADMTLVQGSVKDFKLLCFCADVDAKVGQDMLPGSTGNDALSGAGFTPTGFMYLFNADTTANINAGSGSDIVAQGVCVATDTDSELNSVGGGSGDAVTTTIANSWAAATLRFHKIGNVDHIATVSSWDSDGITFNYSQADAGRTTSYAFLKGRNISVSTLTEDTGPGLLSTTQGTALTTARGVPLKDTASPPNTRDLDATIVPGDITGNLQVEMTWTWTTASQGTVYLLAAESSASPQNGVYVLHNGTNLVYRVTTAGVDSDDTEAHSYSAGDEKTLTHTFAEDVSGVIGSTVNFGRDAADSSRATISLKAVQITSLKVETPILSPEFTEQSLQDVSSTNIEIATQTAGATIYYTLDGTEPDPDSSPTVGTVYTGPFLIVDNTRVRAKASLTDWETSEEVDATYRLAIFADLPQIVDTNQVWPRYDPPSNE